MGKATKPVETSATLVAADGRHEEAFDSATTPLETAQNAAGAIVTRFGLAVGADGSYQNFGAADAGGAVRGDYFSATIGAINQHAQSIIVSCEWVADGKTHVTLTSNMPEAQYRIIADEIRRALTTATR